MQAEETMLKQFKGIIGKGAMRTCSKPESKMIKQYSFFVPVKI